MYLMIKEFGLNYLIVFTRSFQVHSKGQLEGAGELVKALYFFTFFGLKSCKVQIKKNIFHFMKYQYLEFFKTNYPTPL